MGAEITSRGFTQLGPLNHGEVQAAASATSAAFHLVSAVDPPLEFRLAAPIFLGRALRGGCL
jgi:hypothetical protein